MNAPSDPKIAKGYTRRFRLYATIAMVLVILQGVRIYQNSAASENVQRGFNDSLRLVHSELQQSDTGRQVDNAYLKAKLEDAYRVNDQLRELAPALMKMATTSAEYTKKQFETKVLSANQLRDFTKIVIKKIRDLQNQYHVASQQNMDLLMQPLADGSISKEDLQTRYGSRNEQYRQKEEQVRFQYEQIYRSSIMADAAYARRELLSRIGGDGFLQPREKGKSIAIDGIMAGPDPIGESADYLEALVRRLSP